TPRRRAGRCSRGEEDHWIWVQKVFTADEYLSGSAVTFWLQVLRAAVSCSGVRPSAPMVMSKPKTSSSLICDFTLSIPLVAPFWPPVPSLSLVCAITGEANIAATAAIAIVYFRVFMAFLHG